MTAPVNHRSAWLALAEPLVAAGTQAYVRPFLRELRARRRRQEELHARLTAWGAWLAGASIVMSAVKVLSVVMR